MPRSSFGPASLLSALAVLGFCSTASAQWMSNSSGSSCGCNAPSYMGPPPIMRQTAAFFGAAPMSTASYAYNDGVQCGQPVACRIEQPVQQMQVVHIPAAPVIETVAVQPMQPVHQAVMQDVRVVEYKPVKQTVSRPVMRTEYVDQMVTEMRPVSELKTQQVATVDYQTVTEYKTVQKQVGYWATKNCPTGRVPSWQYDNRPNALGAINRASYDARNAFTPQYKEQRQFIPQTMTCTVPCSRKVAVPGMKQVTYKVTRTVPTQVSRKVAVNKMSYETAEVTVMRPVQTVKTMQVGTRISYVPAGTTVGTGGAPATALSPTADPNASQKMAPRSANRSDMDADNFDRKKDGASLETADPYGQQLGENTTSARKFTTPSVVRVSQWVARTPASSVPQPGGKSTAISVADTTR